ncbi:MAG: lipid II flippase MurJ, partial [Candidatus Aerophobetes bacterium]|nr:lipid II flippase MurJ [Candidatus Aerophobetes bacterium]
LIRAFYSLQDVITPLKVSAVVVALNTLLNFLLISPLKHSGLALATSISMMFNMIILFFLLKRRLRKMEGEKIIACLLKVIFISTAMGIGVYSLLKFVSPLLRLSSLGLEIVQVSGAIGTGMGIFCLLSFFLRLEEFKVVIHSFKVRG